MAIKGVAGQLQLVFDEYAKKLDIKTDDIMHETAIETRDYLIENSPERIPGGEYAKSWTVSKKQHQFIVHNKEHYRLTHLLEKGHLIKNQYGYWSRRTGGDKTTAIPHIRKAEENGIHLLFGKLEKEL